MSWRADICIATDILCGVSQTGTSFRQHVHPIMFHLFHNPR